MLIDMDTDYKWLGDSERITVIGAQNIQWWKSVEDRLLPLQQALKVLPKVAIVLVKLPVQQLKVAVPTTAILLFVGQEKLVALLLAELFGQIGVGISGL